jgi:hypothetical protein
MLEVFSVSHVIENVKETLSKTIVQSSIIGGKKIKKFVIAADVVC